MKEINKMKNKLKKFNKLQDELKNHCYELGNKWNQYEVDLYKEGWYYTNLSNTYINDLTFEYDEGEMSIGYENYYCGDIDRYYNSFTEDEVINENLIKEKIDKRYKKLQEEKLKNEEEERLKKEASEKKEFEIYKRLKEKYENNT